MVILMTKELNLPWTPYVLGVGSFLFLQPPPPNQETQNTAIHGGQMNLYARQHSTRKKLKPLKKTK
jgi:hypothetical protein